jgi:hypothetical protein
MEMPAILKGDSLTRLLQGAAAATNMVELKKVSSYQQGSFIEKGGWATLPGGDGANSSVARACAEMLSSLK